MGAYGSPDLKEPPEVKYHPPVNREPVQHMINVCRYCHNEYNGYFCPFCGTQVGDKKPKRITAKHDVIMVTIGIVIEFVVFMLFLYFGMHMR